VGVTGATRKEAEEERELRVKRVRFLSSVPPGNAKLQLGAAMSALKEYFDATAPLRSLEAWVEIAR